MEVVFLEQGGLPDGGLHESLRGGLAVLLEQTLVQGACIDTNADGDPSGFRRAGNSLDLIVEPANIARVHTNGRATGVNGRVHVLGLEMDVRNHRNR